MAHLTVVATIKGKPAKQDELRDLLDSLIVPTRAETGCLRYDLHRSTEEPATFLFYETWADRAVWDRHMETPHLAAFKAALDDLTESFTLFVGEAI